MLDPNSGLTVEKDWQKYEKARELGKKIKQIRDNYKNDLNAKGMYFRQRAVALYFIDKVSSYGLFGKQW